MRLVKNIKTIIKISVTSLALSMLCLLLGISNVACFWIFLCNQVLVVALLYATLLKPLKIFEKTLEQNFEAESENEKALEDISDDIVFIKEIKIWVERCANQKNRENSAEMFNKQAELAALQSQINPHFLYNTLESIRGQALMDDNYDIAKMVEALASFFRYSISRKGELVTLRDELSNIQNYMMILRYRFNNRFSLEIYIDDEDQKAYDYFIPKLILQPVVENAIFHGLEECLEGGRVSIEVIVTKTSLILTVSDNGKGMDSKALIELNQRIHLANQYREKEKEEKHRTTGIALPNIHMRIQLLFGSEYGVNVYSTLNLGTDVEITIPANHERNVR
ncbi:MAG: sensor histidine kinase [Velocimicrobium sp.]